MEWAGNRGRRIWIVACLLDKTAACIHNQQADSTGTQPSTG